MRRNPAPAGPTLAPSGPEIPAVPGPTANAGVARQPASSVVQLPQSDTDHAKYHTVRAGDSWSSVAQKYHLTVKDLTDANGIDPSTALQPGQMVFIPEK